MRTQEEILKERARMKAGRKLFNMDNIPQRQRPKKPQFKNKIIKFANKYKRNMVE
jgi:hypothetical protein